jgi:hypothetical protein
MAKSIYTNSEVDETNPFYYAATNQVSPDNPFYSYARSPEQTAEDDYATEVKAVVDSVDNNTWDWNDTLLTARSFVDGLYLNKAEEIGSWVSAATFKLLYPELAGDQPVSEIRKEMLLDLEAESARFIEERPVAAMTSNIAGAVLSPVSIATGKGLAQAANLRRGSQQLASQASAQTVLKGAGAADEAALASQQLAQQYSGLSPRIYDVVTRTPTPVLASGAAAVEGGIIGYEGEDKLQSAVTTGAVSAVVPFAFEGAKYALNAPIKRE